MNKQTFEFDVCLSFAGENRQYVRNVAQQLKDAGKTVFYDEDEAVNLWGEDLYTYLDDIYRNKSRYCVLFISSHYARKEWTRHERKSAQARALKERATYLLPVRFDDTDLPGLVPTVGYVDVRNKSAKVLTNLILEKLDGKATATSDEPPLVTVQASPTRDGRMQLAQMRVVNNGNSPIKLIGYFDNWGENLEEATFTEHYDLKIPPTLSPGSQCEITVKLGTEDIRQLQGLGVVDSQRRHWSVESSALGHFVHTAHMNRFPEHLLSPELVLPETTDGQSVEIRVGVDRGTFPSPHVLHITVDNNGNRAILVNLVEIKWTYSPPRQMTPPGQKPSVSEPGGSIQIGHPDAYLPIGPKESRVYKVDRPWSALLMQAVAADSDLNQLQVIVRTSKKSAWVLTNDGLPEAVLEVATSVANAESIRR